MPTVKPSERYNYSFGAITVAVSTSATGETTLGTITIPQEFMGANGWIRVHALWARTGGNWQSTMRIKFDGNTFHEIEHIANIEQYDMKAGFVWNKNSTSSQGSGLLIANEFNDDDTVYSSSVNTSDNDVDITFTGFVANAAATLALNFASVEVFRVDI